MEQILVKTNPVAYDLYLGTIETLGAQKAGEVKQVLTKRLRHSLPKARTTVTLEPVGVAGLITPWKANALFFCAKLAFAVAAGAVSRTRANHD
jgi:acyl-CoA reductase-like NAD-dependent aldehyde dehydrogenase